jgi:Tfp pilus assembly protein PilF
MRTHVFVSLFLCSLLATPSFAETAAELVQKGEAALAQHDAATAMQNFDKAMELDPQNGPAAFNRAKIRLKIGELPGAISDFTIAIIADPKNAAAYDGRGQTKLKLKQPDPKGAFEDFQLGINAAPDRAEPLLVRASYFIQFGNFAGAKADLEKALPLADEKTAEGITRMLARLK